MSEHAPNTIDVSAGGPLICRGALTISLASSQLLGEETSIALCRCGASQNKPYCDGSHHTVGFGDAGAIDLERFKPKDSEPGVSALSVVLSPNGPLIATGPLAITSADGSVCVKTGRAALCRCGASENKPFCDGAHKRIAFVAD